MPIFRLRVSSHSLRLSITLCKVVSWSDKAEFIRFRFTSANTSKGFSASSDYCGRLVVARIDSKFFGMASHFGERVSFICATIVVLYEHLRHALLINGCTRYPEHAEGRLSRLKFEYCFNSRFRSLGLICLPALSIERSLNVSLPARATHLALFSCYIFRDNRAWSYMLVPETFATQLTLYIHSAMFKYTLPKKSALAGDGDLSSDQRVALVGLSPRTETIDLMTSLPAFREVDTPITV